MKTETAKKPVLTIEHRLQAAMQGNSVDTYAPEELLPRLTTMIVQAYTIVGYQNFNETDISYLAGKLRNDLLETYPYFTPEEVAFCIEQGAKGEYGDYQGVNLRSLTAWLKAYRGSSLRRRVCRHEQTAALPPVTEEYQEHCFKRHMRSLYERYKRHEFVIETFFVYAYVEMEKMGWISNTPEEKRQALEEARAKYGRLFELQGKKGEDLERDLINKARIILLYRHYDRWIEAEKKNKLKP